jgi:group I intron endonuclease
MKSGIYVWKLNGVPKYIGKSLDVHRRMVRSHNDSEALNHAIEKYGYDAFEKEVICYCAPEELNKLEEFYIRELGTHRSVGGYNLTFGGDGQGSGEAHPLYGVTGENHPSWGRKNSKETLEKMSAAHTGITHSQEAKQKIAETKKGKRNPFFGIKYENATSKYYGVCKVGRKYRVLINVNKRLIHVGYFGTEEEAGWKYNEYVIENGLKDYPLNDI